MAARAPIATEILHASATHRCLSTECMLRSVDAGGPLEAASAGPLPRVIWTYWHEAELPPLARACMFTWRRRAAGWEVRLLNAKTVTAWLDEGSDFPPLTWSRIPQHQSDVFGLALLRRYGGVYMDATIAREVIVKRACVHFYKQMLHGETTTDARTIVRGVICCIGFNNSISYGHLIQEMLESCAYDLWGAFEERPL